MNKTNKPYLNTFLEECTVQVLCPYCGAPSSTENPFCCGEVHCCPHLVAPNGVILGVSEDSINDEVLDATYAEWAKERKLL